MRAKEFDQGDRKQIHQILLWNHFIKGSPKNMPFQCVHGSNRIYRFILTISMDPTEAKMVDVSQLACQSLSRTQETPSNKISVSQTYPNNLCIRIIQTYQHIMSGQASHHIRMSSQMFQGHGCRGPTAAL